jgi:hypothetical protein
MLLVFIILVIYLLNFCFVYERLSAKFCKAISFVRLYSSEQDYDLKSSENYSTGKGTSNIKATKNVMFTKCKRGMHFKYPVCSPRICLCIIYDWFVR